MGEGQRFNKYGIFSFQSFRFLVTLAAVVTVIAPRNAFGLYKVLLLNVGSQRVLTMSRPCRVIPLICMASSGLIFVVIDRVKRFSAIKIGLDFIVSLKNS